MANILIASLGESPVVVPVMYRLLKEGHNKERHNIEIDEVHVLTPEDYRVAFSYDMVEDELKEECQPTKIDLGFEDTHTEQECLQFLKLLVNILMEQQQKQNSVYLSLAGGRKSMSALIAWTVPLFSCVKQLYHVIDPDEELFPSLEDFFKHSESVQKRLMHPGPEKMKKLNLVKIPFAPEEQMSSTMLARLLYLNEQDLDKFEAECAETIRNTQRIINGERTLEVLITQPALDQYKKYQNTDVFHARSIEEHYLAKFGSARLLKSLIHPWKGNKNVRSGPFILHFCESKGTAVRPVIYTQPSDIRSGKIEEVEKVVVCGFEIEKADRQITYHSLEEIKSSPHFSREPVGPVYRFLPAHEDTKKEDILLVPLGTHPMIVTQLYTLFTEKGKQIRNIVLFYPGNNQTICDGVELLDLAIEEEKVLSGKDIQLTKITIPEEDIDSEKACMEYQQALEKEIKRIQEGSLAKNILLSLSGGRKGMAAMTIFAARNMGLPRVYHTLITNKTLNDKIEQETTIKVLNQPKIDETERNNRLFLRSYDRDQFVVFPIPVVPKELFTASW